MKSAVNKGITHNVGELLKDQPATRDNDLWLLIKYVERYHGVQSLEGLKALAMNKGLSVSSLIRRRRDYQTKGEYL